MNSSRKDESPKGRKSAASGRPSESGPKPRKAPASRAGAQAGKKQNAPARSKAKSEAADRSKVKAKARAKARARPVTDSTAKKPWRQTRAPISEVAPRVDKAEGTTRRRRLAAPKKPGEERATAAVSANATEAAADDEGSLESLRAERSPRYTGLPVVVIAGRPNVGKSTLYNRLLRKRRTITDPTPGVTRDPVESVCLLRDTGKPVLLIDTGGFKLEREGLDSLVVEKSLQSLERADLILFLVDAMEITPEDEEFASLLRRWGSKILLVVNKADSPERDPLVWGHAKWGFDPVLFVSAEHGRNMAELEEAIVARLDFSRVQRHEPDSREIRVAIMGKPNTGKSTLLNRLLGEEKSIVSEIAGTTRDVVEGSFEWKGRRIVVLDTAGIRRKAKVTEAVEYYSVNRAIRTVNDCDVVILMIDAQEGLTEQDKKITAFAAEKGRGVIFVLNKWDTMPDIKNGFEAARDKLRYFFGQMSYAPVLPLSAREGTGVDKLLNSLLNVHAQLTKEIETSRLNKSVSAWIEETPPPVGPRTHFKLRYATQTSANPLRFVFFVTRPDAVKDSYISFLRNKIRDELGYDKVPLFVELRASRSR
jgi:GTP-binding protein